MLAILAVAAAISTPVEATKAEMSCSATGAHLTFQRGARSLSADAKPGETIVVDMVAWTATAKTVFALKPSEYGYKAIGAAGDKPQSAVLDCSSPDAPAMRVETFPAG